MDYCARIWQRIGHLFELRPMTVIGVTAGAVIFASSMTYLLVSQHSVRDEVDKITEAFCNGQAPRTQIVERNCRALLDQLLLNPTEAQKERIRQIAKERN